MTDVVVVVNGQEIAAQTFDGEPPTVVLVSGMGERWGYWQPMIDSLSSGSRIVTYDRPGIGGSPPRALGRQAVSYGGFAAELAAMLDQVGAVDPAVIVGHSLGSLIIRAFGGMFPGRVAGMVHLDGTVPGWSFDWPGSRSNLDGDGENATRIKESHASGGAPAGL